MNSEPPHNCRLCPRLAAFRDENEARHPDFFNAPVPSFGDRQARLLVVGLAPGLKGANATGRPFTGDYAGDLLYKTLGAFGFSNDKYQGHPNDRLRLNDCMITNAVRCVPPENKPVGLEIRTCRRFLKHLVADMPNLQVILPLGKIAHDSTARALGLKLSGVPFGHNSSYKVPVKDGKPPVFLISSYHCSRYNTNTGRLTEDMFADVFRRVRRILGD